MAYDQTIKTSKHYFLMSIVLVQVSAKRLQIIRCNIHKRALYSWFHLNFRKLAKFALVLIPLFGVTYIVTAAYPIGLDYQADIIYLYWDMFYNSFQVH